MNLSVYSITFTPRNAVPKNIVATSHMTCVLGFALVCAERTAIAIVSELTIRTTVFTPPQTLLRCALASWNALGFAQRYIR